MSAKLIILVTALGLSAPGHAAPPVGDAGAAVARAQQAMDGKRYGEAAAAMEEAYRADPDPQWLANAGYAHMLAGEEARAIELLSRALADVHLSAQARDKAAERLNRAASARALIERGDEARTAGRTVAAARAFDGVATLVPVGAFYLAAAEEFERSGAIDIAHDRYQRALAMGDLSDGQRRDATLALDRTAARAAPPAPVRRDIAPPTVVARHDDDDTAEWVLIGSGAAAVGVGFGAFLAMRDVESDFDARVRDGRYDGTRAEAAAAQSDATAWRNAALIATGVGLTAATVGVILLATGDVAPEPDQSLTVGAAATRDGGLLTVLGRF